MPPKSIVRCRSCQRELPRDAFDIRYLSSGRVNGIKTSCRECVATRFERQRTRALARLADRFWSKVDRSGGPDACWEWQASRLTHGHYGQIHVPGIGPIVAHRVAWELANGPIPDGLWALHRCDNPPCCNPAHLFLGTVGDNNADRNAKGRTRPGHVFGEIHGMSRLTEADIVAIRALRGTSQGRPAAVGRAYGISASHAGRILSGQCWKHIEGAKHR